MNNNNNQGQIVASRDILTSKIKRWVQLDSQLKLINEKTKLMREERNTLSNDICEELNKAGIANRKIILPDGDLKVYEKKDYSQLTFSFLEQHLGNIMTDPQQVSMVIDYLKQHREITITSDLKRNYTH